MTPAVTDRVFRSDGRGEEPVDEPGADSPYERRATRILTRARPRLAERSARFRRAAAGWWLLTARPMSIQDAWRASGAVEPERIPLRSRPLRLAWRWSNRTDRVLLFALGLLVPSCLVGALLWVAARPSRRLGFWAVALALVLGLSAAGHGP
jgi:hypothetical protein